MLVMNGGEIYIPGVDKQQYDDGRLVATRLDKLHPKRVPNSIFREGTPIEIYGHPVEDGTEYSVLVGYPLRGNDISEMLKAASKLRYDGAEATSYLLNSEDNGFSGEVRPNLKVIGELLEAPDDTNFLKELASRIKPHDQAWMDLVNQRGFAAKLADQIGKEKPDPELFDIAKDVVAVMRSSPSLWTLNQRNEWQSKDETLIQRFASIPGPSRKAILDLEMEKYGDGITAEQKRRIDLTNGIRFEIRHNELDWYLTGRNGDVEEAQQDGETEFIITSGDNKATIKPTEDRFEIKPESKPYLPVISWLTDKNGRRRLVVPSKFQKEKMVITADNNRNVSFIYDIKPEQLSNPITGLMALQYILDFAPSDEFPPEQTPELAILRTEKIMQSDFIQNAESQLNKI